MNRRIVFNILGRILVSEAVLLILPIIVALIYGENAVYSLLITVMIALVLGLPLVLLSKPKSHVIFAKEGFLIVSLAWISMSVVGAFPFFISGEIPSFIDAFFETVSGFTTTGSSILTDVEAMSKSLLFWRSFTHWVGGMGVLVFIMALIPNIADRSIHIIRAEMPGTSVGKLVPKVKDTAKILYLIYIALTCVLIVLLIAGGMPVFDSFVHAFGTAGTGGFGIKADSIAGYSPYIQWVITIFMLLFGINFNLYFLILIRRFKSVLKSIELWTYLGIVTISTVSICANIFSMYENFAEAFRHSAFQVSSIITTTGFATADFNLWPEFSKTLLIMLMFIGGCSGSTAGGLKVSRIIMMFKTIKREIKHLLHPRSVESIKFEGKRIEEDTLSSTNTYFATYMFCFFVILIVLSFDKTDFITNFTATVACFNNIGPGLGAVGPASSFANYSDVSKIVLSFAMLFGRLEIYPMIIALSPATWIKK